MKLSTTAAAVIIQAVIFLTVRAIQFFPEIDPENYFYIGTLTDFGVSLSLGTVWVIAFHQFFPGQFLVFLILGVLSILSLRKYHQPYSKKGPLIVFHSATIAWTLLPLLASQFGNYSGP